MNGTTFFKIGPAWESTNPRPEARSVPEWDAEERRNALQKGFPVVILHDGHIVEEVSKNERSQD